MAVPTTNQKGLSFASTETFRKTLMAKNLAPYKVQGVFSPPVQNINYEIVQTDSSVINSPDSYISDDPFAKNLYPLNKFGPNGGYNLNVTYNGPPLPVDSNQGEYAPKDTKMDLLNEFYIDLSYIENKYGPQGGYQNMITVTDIQNNNKIYANYWGPPSFVPSSYTPLSILQNNNPSGSDGNLSSDSFIAKLGAQTLKNLFQERIDVQRRIDNPNQNQLQSLKDPYTAGLMASGKQPLITRNYSITVPETPQSASSGFIARLGDTYYPTSPIPGSYWEENTLFAGATSQVSTALNALNTLAGGLLGNTLNTVRNPSQIFIANTGDGQKSILFSNLDYNRYKPEYDRTTGGIVGLAQNVVRSILTALGDPTGGYYIGSPRQEPSQITSPANQLPVNAFGQQVASPVYGPSELGKLYEGNDENINFGLQARSFEDGGGIDGSLVWVSPKYKNNAGFKVGKGGSTQSQSDDFNLISNSYLKSESTNITFKTDSILDNTQRLIDSADNVQGQRRLKHVGNAINQVSKVFNDGYRELTKGSKVLKYVDNATGKDAGTEYSRVFSKDTPYYTYKDLQKFEGITTQNRKFNNSVLDNTFNLNIAPTPLDKGSTNIVKKNGVNSVKKYMFSIENLAWRTSSRDGFTYDDLPESERGPNGGRIMWFPPYNIKFSESVSPSFTPISFLGRPEPIYTYGQTTRTGQLSWSIIVDHPSILNLIVKKQLNGENKQKVQEMIESFFAGALKYDLITLSKKFNQIPSSKLQTYQNILSNPNLKTEDLEQVKSELGTTTQQTQDESDPSKSNLENNFKGYSFYFEFKIPNLGSSAPYQSLYTEYTSSKNIDTYTNLSKGLSNTEKNTKEFFEQVVKQNFEKITSGNENDGLLLQLYNYLSNKKGSVKILLDATVFHIGSDEYFNSLNERRRNSIVEFFRTYKINNNTLNDFIDNKTLIVELLPSKVSTTTPITSGGKGAQIDCSKVPKTGVAQQYSVGSMGCRRLSISSINITPNPPTTQTSEQPKTLNSSTKNPPKQTIVGVEEKLKQGITKKVLRDLLTEDSYFELLKDNVPMIYESITEKIKYFNPTFHSITPEGLNSRLTFLQQCTRPGDTIPVIGPDGKPRFNDALNTSFGAPPILVLRIGDFYNTKIVPTSFGIAYEPLVLDTNPEGIGVQPMIANVTLSFNFIGGSGLAKPIEQLQNAISFNYYANTEIYDERATPTEDVTAIDKEVFQSILDKEPSASVESLINSQQNAGGSTIGQILSSQSTAEGTTGDISYTQIMDKLYDDNKEYFTSFLNQTDKLFKSYSLPIIQLIGGQGPSFGDRLYTTGTLDPTNPTKTQIFGKCNLKNANSQIDRFQELFKVVMDDINYERNPLIISVTKKIELSAKELGLFKTYLNEFVNNLSVSFSQSSAQILQQLTNQQQNFVQTIRKINLILTNTDGNVAEGGLIKVYNLTGDENIKTLKSNSKKVNDNLLDFIKDCIDKSLIFQNYSDYTKFTPLVESLNNIADKPFYMVIIRTLVSNKRGFRNSILKGELLKNKKFVKQFDSALDALATKYKEELTAEEKQFNKSKKIISEKYIKGFENLTYPKGKLIKLTYSTVSIDALKTQQEKDIRDLYSTVNVDTFESTFDGKITFN